MPEHRKQKTIPVHLSRDKTIRKKPVVQPQGLDDNPCKDSSKANPPLAGEMHHDRHDVHQPARNQTREPKL